MLDGRFDPEFHRALVNGQISASDLAREDPDSPAHFVGLRVWLASLVLVIPLCIVLLA